MKLHTTFRNLFISVFLVWAVPAAADVITLKTGMIVEGTISRETEETILVDLPGSSYQLTFNKDQIKDIQKTSSIEDLSAPSADEATTAPSWMDDDDAEPDWDRVDVPEPGLSEEEEEGEEELAPSPELSNPIQPEDMSGQPEENLSGLNNPEPAVEPSRELSTENLSFAEKVNLKKQTDSVEETRQKTVLFLESVFNIDNQLNSTLNDYLKILDHGSPRPDRKRVIEILLEMVRQIQLANDRVVILSPTSATGTLKETMLEYYEQLTAYHSALLKKFTQAESQPAIDTLSQAATSLEVWETQFNTQFDQLSQDYGIRELPSDYHSALPSSGSAPQVPTGSKGLDSQYSALLNQTKELVDINEALKKELSDSLRRNQIMQEQMEQFLDKSAEQEYRNHLDNE